MKKALEILKELQDSKVSKFFCIDRLNKAIKELEALEDRSCKSCKFLHQDYLCLELGDGIKPIQLGLKYCSNWELK